MSQQCVRLARRPVIVVGHERPSKTVISEMRNPLNVLNAKKPDDLAPGNRSRLVPLVAK